MSDFVFDDENRNRLNDMEEALKIPVLMAETPDQSVVKGLGTIMKDDKFKSKMKDYIIYKDDKLYVRTYDTDYVFEVQK